MSAKFIQHTYNKPVVSRYQIYGWFCHRLVFFSSKKWHFHLFWWVISRSLLHCSAEIIIYLLYLESFLQNYSNIIMTGMKQSQKGACHNYREVKISENALLFYRVVWTSFRMWQIHHFYLIKLSIIRLRVSWLKYVFFTWNSSAANKIRMILSQINRNLQRLWRFHLFLQDRWLKAIQKRLFVKDNLIRL